MLWLKGKNFDPEQVAAALSIAPCEKWRQGEARGRRTHTSSGLSFVASEAGFDSFRQQVTDVVAFIQVHKSDLLLLGKLASTLDEGHFYIDFGIYTRMSTVYAQVDVFSTVLVKLCGEVGLSIVLSQYSPDSTEDDNG